MSENVGRGFNLVMELEDPARLPELMEKLKMARPRIQRSLASLDYVHYSRFLPLWDRGLLLIVTEFDGEMKDYVTDFAVVLDAEFSLILSYMKGYDKRHLPVSRHPDAFWRYVDTYTKPKVVNPAFPLPPHPEPFGVYQGKTVLEIAGGLRAKQLPAPLRRDPEPAVPLEDVQGHVLRAYRAARAQHLFFVCPDAAGGRAMLSRLAPLVSNERTVRDQPACVTVGLTHAGLQALGLPQDLLDRFPQAFREGPRLRSERLGDTGRNHPRRWAFAGYQGDPPADGRADTRPLRVVHGMVSVYSSGGADGLRAALQRVKHAMHGVQVTDGPQAEALGGRGEIHFGYRDGIAQPRFADAKEPDDARGAARSAAPPAERAPAPPGDLLLGPGYRNSRGGYFIGELPAALATHGTYAALRVIEQDVVAFEQLLRDVQREHQVDPELFAAKLVGRWRNGEPLAREPVAPPSNSDQPKDQQAWRAFNERAAAKSAAQLDAFDYAGAHAPFDDREGRRCPFGAHIRRLNPRSGMVLGVPWGRVVVRRGMPYGPRYVPGAGSEPKPPERGLVGLFLCGDLESQFEFIQHVWANQDLSAPGLRGTQDPFGSAHAHGTPFRFHANELEAPITVTVPPLTTVRGSAYLFLPGLKGLAWLAAAGWMHDAG